MQSQQVVVMLGVAVALGVAGTFSDTRADDRMCVREAREIQAECRTLCRDDFLTERDLCRDIDPDCGDACRVAYADCRTPFDEIVASCKDACRTDFLAARDVCPPASDPARDACVDEAQVHAFVCRDDCREDRQVRSGRRDCARARRQCVDACPPPDTPPPPPDPGLG